MLPRPGRGRPAQGVLRAMGCLVLAALASQAVAESDSEQITAVAHQYEATMAKAYGAVQGPLSDWEADQRRQALANLTNLMQSNSGEARLFVAFHILVIDPANADARAAFADAKVDPPLDETGKPTGVFTLSAAVDTALAAKVSVLSYPSLQVVAQAVDIHSPLVASYWETQRQAIQELRSSLLAFQDPDDQTLIFSLLAYYYPQAREVGHWFHDRGLPVPTQRWWVDQVDQFLIDHELVTMDILTSKAKYGSSCHKLGATSWTVPMSTWVFPTVRSCRVEGVVTLPSKALPAVVLSDERGAGVELVAKGTQAFSLLLLPSHKLLVSGTTPSDLGTGATMELELRDRHVQVALGGLPLLSADLPTAFALHRLAVAGAGPTITASSLRIRFISSQGPRAVIAVATWPEERRQELDKTLTLSLSETPVDEAIAVISRLSGVTISLDESGLLLKDTPISLEARDMRLESVLQRQMAERNSQFLTVNMQS